MNSKNNNFNKYKKYLSPFGTKVLVNLMKILTERNECHKLQHRNHYNFGQDKRVLVFGESYSSLISNQQNEIACGSTFENNKSPFSVLTDELPVIKTSDELLKIPDRNDKCFIKKNDDNYTSGIALTMTETCGNERVTDNIQSVKDHVGWDDIFDTQLLNMDNTHFNAQKEKLEKVDSIQVSTKSENPLYCRKIQEINTSNMTKNINLANTIQIGHPKIGQKTEDSAINHNIEADYRNADMKKGKIKRSRLDKIRKDLPKKLFRKQKYTKAVKLWLNSEDHENNENIMELPKNKEKKMEDIISEREKPEKNENSRKIVQAQLTNKDGIMKFGKPTLNQILAKVNNDNGGDRFKNTKAKAKFMPPVKSQVPVKDVLYHIISFNNDNFKDYVTELSNIKNEELYMFLIFSNGLCQLNSQYTCGDTCEVEGVLFQINNIIYYWKDIYKTFSCTMEKIMRHNTIVCYDGKSLLKYFSSQHNIDVISANFKILDVQIGGNLIDPDNPPENYAKLQELLSFVPEYTIVTECVLQKCAWYLTMLGECFAQLRLLLIENELWKVFVEIEMRVLPIVADMEQRGVRVNTVCLKSMENTLLTRMKATEQACHAAAGRTFQVNSALQVRNILYGELQLDVKSNVRIRETLCKGQKSTSESMLRTLMSVHPLPKLILEYRHVHKAHSTFLAGIANHVNDGVIRPTWMQTAAATGRIVCSNPNLQAIPKAPFSLQLFPDYQNHDEGHEGSMKVEAEAALKFRSVYITHEGCTLLAADFKHIECRVFAHAAADTSLLAALASPDLFRVLAARWLNKPEADVSVTQRERTKRLVYAGLYGAGARTLADTLRVDDERALAIAASFNRTFPSLKSFGRGVVAQCRRRGGRLATLCGRGRRFPDIFSEDTALKAHAERQAVNFVVQGTAADLCKMAMVLTEERLRSCRPPARAHLLLQIHDELVWEVADHDLATAAAIIKSAMEGVGQWCGMAGPLPVALSAGRAWGELRQLAPNTPSSTP